MNLYDVVVAKKLSGGGGGGGSSDFTTAKMTIVNTVPQSFSWECPWFIDDPEFSCAYGDISVTSNATETFDIIMYKGQASLHALPGTAQISISGNIEPDGATYYLITGDCTITIS